MTFDEFYKQHFDYIFNYIFRRTLNYDEALDVAQDVFFKAYRHFGKLAGMEDKAAGTYLFRTANTTIIDHARKSNRTRTLPLEEGTVVVDPNWNIDIEGRRLIDKMRELPDKYQEVLALRYVEGLSYGEIAGILNKNESTLRSLIKRGLEMLRFQAGPQAEIA